MHAESSIKQIHTKKKKFILHTEQVKRIPKFPRLWELVDAIEKKWQRPTVCLHGGSVRDLIASHKHHEHLQNINIPINDWDLLILAPLEAMRELVKVFPGLSEENDFLFLLVEKDGTVIEIARSYQKNMSKEQILEGRSNDVDLTVNAITLEITAEMVEGVLKQYVGEIFDFHGGINDIKFLILRTIDVQDPFSKNANFSSNEDIKKSIIYKKIRVFRIFDLDAKYSMFQLFWKYEEIKEQMQNIDLSFANVIDNGGIYKQLYKNLAYGRATFFIERLIYYKIAEHIFLHFAECQKDLRYMAQLIDAYTYNKSLEQAELISLILWPSFNIEQQKIALKTQENQDLKIKAARNICNHRQIFLGKHANKLEELWTRKLFTNQTNLENYFVNIIPNDYMASVVLQTFKQTLAMYKINEIGPSKPEEIEKTNLIAQNEEFIPTTNTEKVTPSAAKNLPSESGTEIVKKTEPVEKITPEKVEIKEISEKIARRNAKKERRKEEAELQRKIEEEQKKKLEDESRQREQEAIRRREEEEKKQAEAEKKQQAEKQQEEQRKNQEKLAKKKMLLAQKMERTAKYAAEKEKEKQKEQERKKAFKEKKLAETKQVSNEHAVKVKSESSLATNKVEQSLAVSEPQPQVNNRFARNKLLREQQQAEYKAKLEELLKLFAESKEWLIQESHATSGFWKPAVLENLRDPYFVKTTFFRPIYGVLDSILTIGMVYNETRGAILNLLIFHSVISLFDNMFLVIKKLIQPQLPMIKIPEDFDRNLKKLAKKFDSLKELYGTYQNLLEKRANLYLGEVFCVGLAVGATFIMNIIIYDAFYAEISRASSPAKIALSTFPLFFFTFIFRLVNDLGRKNQEDKKYVSANLPNIEKEILELQEEIKGDIKMLIEKENLSTTLLQEPVTNTNTF